jgi:hypothetical protein
VTTTREIETMLKPLLQRHPELVYHKRRLIEKPIRHVLSAVLFDGTAQPQMFRPKWYANYFLGPTFGSGTDLHIAWSVELPFLRPDGWKMNRPDLQGMLVKYVEEEGLLFIRALRRLETFKKFVSRHELGQHLFGDPMQTMTIQAACGFLDSAKWEMKAVRIRLAKPEPRDPNFYAKVATLCDLLEADDLAGMAAHLHAWEAETVRRLKLDQVWEPSPFPLEDLIR